MFGRCFLEWCAPFGSFGLALLVWSSSANAQSAGFPVEPPPQPPASAAPKPPPRPAVPAPVAPPAAVPAPPAPRAAVPAPVAPRTAVPVAAPAAPVTPPRAAAPVAPVTVPVAPPSPVPPALSLGSPAILPYRSGLPVPAGYHVEHRAASGLIGTGIGTIALGYVVGLGVASSHDFDGSLGWMAVPVIGAWPAVAGSHISCNAQDVPAAKQCLSDAYNQATTIAIVAVDGMVQATGVVLLVAGLLSGHSELVRDDLQVSARQRPEGGFDIGVRGSF